MKPEGDKKFVLIKRGLYWRPDGKGYTGIREEAGLYSLDDASMAHCEYMATPTIKATTEYMLWDDAPEYAPGCWAAVKAEHMQKRLDNMKDLLCLADEVIMDAIGCFPQFEGTPWAKQRRDDCLAIRSVTTEDFDARKVGAQRARTTFGIDAYGASV